MPEVFPGGPEQVEKVADLARDRLLRDLNAVPWPSMDFTRRAVERLHGRIEISKNPESYEANGGSLTIMPDLSFTITLSPLTSPLRDNFTIAHELGHLFLHYNQEVDRHGPVVFARYGTNVLERQANRFAAAFLMPKEEFSRKWRDSDGDKSIVAAYFHVSEPAAHFRSVALDLN